MLDRLKQVRDVLIACEKDFASEDIEYDYDDFGVISNPEQLQMLKYRDDKYKGFETAIENVNYIIQSLYKTSEATSETTSETDIQRIMRSMPDMNLINVDNVIDLMLSQQDANKKREL